MRNNHEDEKTLMRRFCGLKMLPVHEGRRHGPGAPRRLTSHVLHKILHRPRRTGTLSLLQIDGVLHDLVEGGDGLRVGLVAALGHDQCRKLLRYVDIRQLQRAPGEGSASA